MPDIQSLHLALGAMSQKERESFLGMALSHQPIEALSNLLLKLDLKELPVNSKVRLVFDMGLFPVGHSYRFGQDRQLNWVVPAVPDHLRHLVYSTSRLINEFQETLECLKNGRGDFVKVFALLNPENMLEMVNRFSTEMDNYTQQLRDANGRFLRSSQYRNKRKGTPVAPPVVPQQTEIAAQEPPVTTEGETKAEEKPKKASGRAKAKEQPQPKEADGAGFDSAPVESGIVAPPPGEDSQAAAQGTEPSEESPTALTAEELAAFGFDVLATATDNAGDTPAPDSVK